MFYFIVENKSSGKHKKKLDFFFIITLFICYKLQKYQLLQQ